MRVKVTSYVVLCASAFVLNFAWEWLQLPLYTGYEKLGSGWPLVLWATLGDVTYILSAALLVALFKRKLDWMPEARASDYLGLAVLGFGIALLVEYKALALHRWTYAPAMPLFLGVGLSPLLQMTFLLPMCVVIVRWWGKSGSILGGNDK